MNVKFCNLNKILKIIIQIIEYDSKLQYLITLVHMNPLIRSLKNVLSKYDHHTLVGISRSFKSVMMKSLELKKLIQLVFKNML